VPTFELQPWWAFSTAFVIATVTSLGGMSGAFLILPFQVTVLGFAGPAATATTHLYNVIATPSGAWRYAREGRLLWPLVLVLALGAAPGIVLGSLARIHWLADPRPFKLFVGVVLLCLGGRLIFSLRRPSRPRAIDTTFVPHVTRFDWRRFEYSFAGQSHGASVPRLAGAAFVVGIVSGTYGIGGGSLLAALLLAFWSLPVHTIGGAALSVTFVTSTVAVLCFWGVSTMGGSADVTPHGWLGLTFGLGGLCGTYTGARLQRCVPARPIEALLMLVMCGLGLSYIVGYFIHP
jgi:uncharacterized protein